MEVVPNNGNCETKICNAANGYPEDQVSFLLLSD